MVAGSLLAYVELKDIVTAESAVYSTSVKVRHFTYGILMWSFQACIDLIPLWKRKFCSKDFRGMEGNDAVEFVGFFFSN